MRKQLVLFVVGFMLGGLFFAGTIQAVQSMLTTSVTFAIRNNKTRQVLVGDYTVVATRIGSRYWRVEAGGETDDKGYIRTQASANLPPAIANALAPLFR
jgi:hypothetical protein